MIVAGGNMTANGTLDVVTDPVFSPFSGQRFDIVTSATTPNGLTYSASYGLQLVRLTAS